MAVICEKCGEPKGLFHKCAPINAGPETGEKVEPIAEPKPIKMRGAKSAKDKAEEQQPEKSEAEKQQDSDIKMIMETLEMLVDGQKQLNERISTVSKNAAKKFGEFAEAHEALRQACTNELKGHEDAIMNLQERVFGVQKASSAKKEEEKAEDLG